MLSPLAHLQAPGRGQHMWGTGTSVQTELIYCSFTSASVYLWKDAKPSLVCTAVIYRNQPVPTSILLIKKGCVVSLN